MSEMQDQPGIPEWDLADRMRKALRYGNVAVGDMAEYLDVRRETVSTWINGRIVPSKQTLRLWAMRCGVTLEWLSTGEAWAPRGSNPQPTDYKVATLHTRGAGLRRRHGRRRDSVRQLIPAA